MAIVGVRWAQDGRRREDGVGGDGLRQEKEAEEVGLGEEQTTKGINECRVKGADQDTRGCVGRV